MASAEATAQSSENSDLIASLLALQSKNHKLLRSSTYPAPADHSIRILSWKMTETKYYLVPSPFPTLARGLFSREISVDSQKEGEEASKTYEIVARGYDKFFNIGEVPWTTWESLEKHTTAPYTLSLKSNGCIIFIAPLTPTKLLITSKHAIGPAKDKLVEMSHAQAGEKWLRKYLENKGKTEADLATRLWESNLTAVAELCDDSFEEHVLGYPPEKTGLHLHGLNVRCKEFNTLTTDLVDAFADEWGFIKTPTIALNTIKEVKDFTRSCAVTGEWEGEPVEGFVVRSHIAGSPASRSDGEQPGPPTSSKGKKQVDRTIPPYNPGASFFFKVKFDEPYMMYRDWREVTKILLSDKGKMNPSNLPRSKTRRNETKVYVRWVIDEIKKDRESFNGFAKGKGIIATRERFLEYLETEEGKKELKRVRHGSGNDSDTASNKSTKTTKNGKEKNSNAAEVATDKFTKTIIVPVAIPGCGKTSVSLALAHIFGFGHTQSDDVHVKKAAPVFIKNVVELLKKHDVVIADKNNHLQGHRQALRDATKNFPKPIRLLALNWSLDQPRATIHRICSDRVQQRGDNHQTLRADSLSRSHEDVIWKFINTTEELVPKDVDNIVEMELGESLEESVKRAVQGCVAVMGLEMPSDEKIQEGLDIARGYTPGVKKPDAPIDMKRLAVRYYGLLPELDLEELLERAFANESESNKDFWTTLKTKGRVTKRPHVTIVHRSAIDTERELWDRCTGLHEMSTATPPLFKGTLRNIVWDGRVMAVTVEDFDVAEGSSDESKDNNNEQAREFVSNLADATRFRLHITVGTLLESVKPVEARSMVEQWKRNEEPDIIKSIKLDDQVVYGRIKGLVT